LSTKRYDIAIVGSGLAGCTIAFKLKHAGKKVLIIDKPQLSSSSRIAAGVYNPIIFKRTTLTWKANETILSCIDFYNKVETVTGNKFHFPVKMNRIISGYEEQNEWVRKSGLPVYSDFIDDKISSAELLGCKTPFGYAQIKHTGYINTKKYIETVLSFVGQENFLEETFDYSKLTVSEHSLTYGDISFDKIVFCEGHLVEKNPWFSFIPLYPVKGEVIEIEYNGIESNTIYSGGVYFVAMDSNKIKIGGTYDWDNLNETITEKAKTELLDKTKQFYTGEIKVTNQLAGIRPASKDRRPIVGAHPQNKNIYILNGLGTKGVSLVPWCSDQLINLFEKGIQPDKEINSDRFS
jgi:glycine oxidase